MNSRQSAPRRHGIRSSLLALLAIGSANAQITVDGVRDVAETTYTERAVQTITTGWGTNNVLANLHTAQDGSNLAVFIAGRPQGNAILLFIDSKAGGSTFIPNNLITSGGEEYTINNLGSSASAGLTFETGFAPDYVVRVYGDGNGTSTYVNRYNLATGVRDYVGEAGTVSPVASGFVTAIRSTWAGVSPPYNTATNGVEMKLSLAALGVPTGASQPVKLMAVLVNGGSDYASNQVLGSRTSAADIGGGIKTINFEVETGIQTLSLTVDNTDTDGDGTPNASDPDDDNDGLPDTSETNTGTYVDSTHTGSNPLVADTDGDGPNDGAEVAGNQFGLGAGNVSNPNIANYTTMAVPGSYTTPQWQVDGSASNSMTRAGVSLADQNQWTLVYRFAARGDIQYKFAADGAYTHSWGDAGNNIASTIPATGFHTFSFNNATLARSLARTVFPDVAAFLTAYGVAAGNDDDGDGINNENEFSGAGNVNNVGNTDPTNPDSDGDGLPDNTDPEPLVTAPQSRDVVFNVDMSVQIAKGNFQPASGSVVVKIFSGIMNGSPDLPMTDANHDGIYETAPVTVAGFEGANFGTFKFFNTTPAAPNTGYETGADRNFVLGPDATPQNVPDPTPYFSGDGALPLSYDEWANVYSLAPDNARTADPDHDGITNLQEFLFGTTPNAATPSLVTTTPGTGNVILTWLQRTDVSGYTLLQNTDLGAWTVSPIAPVNAADQNDVPFGYTRRQATVPATDPHTFFRVQGVEF